MDAREPRLSAVMEMEALHPALSGAGNCTSLNWAPPTTVRTSCTS
jgi:hypothetical protein